MERARVKSVVDEMDSLAPHRYGDHHVEPLQSYVERIRPLLPNYPDDVLEQWLYRHWHCVRETWSWLGLHALSFVKVIWPASQIYSQVKSGNQEAIDGWSQQFRREHILRESYVGKFMLQHRTWPVPPIVVRNDHGLTMPHGLKLGEPYNLLEGHHRLAYLRSMYEYGSLNPCHVHPLWVATVDPTQVVASW